MQRYYCSLLYKWTSEIQQRIKTPSFFRIEIVFYGGILIPDTVIVHTHTWWSSVLQIRDPHSYYTSEEHAILSIDIPGTYQVFSLSRHRYHPSEKGRTLFVLVCVVHGLSYAENSKCVSYIRTTLTEVWYSSISMLDTWCMKNTSTWYILYYIQYIYTRYQVYFLYGVFALRFFLVFFCVSHSRRMRSGNEVYVYDIYSTLKLPAWCQIKYIRWCIVILVSRLVLLWTILLYQVPAARGKDIFIPSYVVVLCCQKLRICEVSTTFTQQV